MAKVVVMPKLGLTMTEGTVSKWLKKVGDAVTQGEPLFDVETDKLTNTIEASASGVLRHLFVEEGTTVPVLERSPSSRKPVRTLQRSSAEPLRPPRLKRLLPLPQLLLPPHRRKRKPAAVSSHRLRQRNWQKRRASTLPSSPAPARTDASPKTM